MKYLDLETCKYLQSIGCKSESGMWWKVVIDDYNVPDKLVGSAVKWHSGNYGGNRKNEKWEEYTVAAYSLEDVLRRENAEKICVEAWRSFDCKVGVYNEKIINIFQSHPKDWPEKVAEIIKER